MIVKIVNQAYEPYSIEINGKKRTMLDKTGLKMNKSACVTQEFIDLMDAWNYVLKRAYTRRFELDLYGDPIAGWDAKITILDGNILE